MAEVQLIMPKMGESIFEATILTWLKKPGDKIEQDESVLEVATDKVDTEVPSTHAGVLKEILAKEGEVVKVGKPIAIVSIETEADVPVNAPAQAPKKAEPVTSGSSAAVKETMSVSTNGSHPSGNGSAASYKASNRFYSPLVKNIAKEENIAVAELETISGTGSEGRVTKRDILNYVQHRKLGVTVQSIQQHRDVSSAPQRVPVSISGGDEIIEMD